MTKLILKPSTLAISSLHKLVNSHFLLKSDALRLWWHLFWSQRAWAEHGGMTVLRGSVQLSRSTEQSKIPSNFCCAGCKWEHLTLVFSFPDAETTCLSWHTGKYCSSVKDWHRLLPPFRPYWEQYCGSLAAGAAELHAAPHWRINYKSKWEIYAIQHETGSAECDRMKQETDKCVTTNCKR